MKIIYLFLFLFVFGVSIEAQSDSVEVTIQVISEKLSESINIYISGNNMKLGNWHPNRAKLERKNNYWESNFTFDLNTLLEFKFTQGTWETQALNNDGEIPGNIIVNVTQDTTLTYRINYWNMGAEKTTVKGQITGTVKYHKNMTYSNLSPRDVIVWLPPGYDVSVEQNYPVLYMQDGQNIFDPNTSYTKVDWQIDESADSLIKNNEISPMIIVGIYNTGERSAEYTPSLTNSFYKKFVVEKLKPFIDSTYRTLSDREYTYVGGSSSGGTISFMLLWEYSNIFSKAACFSPAFVTQFFNYVEEMDSSLPSNNIEVYLDNGGVGLDAKLQPGIDLVIESLEKKGFREGKNYWIVLDKEAEHSESAWAKRVPNMLKLLFSR